MKIPGVSVGGGRRNAIGGFSGRSRRALLQLVNSIDQGKMRADQVALLTLTYPKVYPDPRGAKQHLKRLLQRYQRAYGRRAVIWKLEPQQREAPHFHCLVFGVSLDNAEFSREVSWWAHTWHEIAGAGDRNHLRWHLGQLSRSEPCLQRIREWNGVTSYAAKYLGKVVLGTEWDRPGRWWGKHNGDLLPITIEQHSVSVRVAAILRRACVRFYEHQESGRYRCVGRSGEVVRGFLDKEQRRVAQFFDMSFRPIHRRWRARRGGCAVFMSAATFERLVAWAFADSGTGSIKQSARISRLHSEGKCITLRE